MRAIWMITSRRMRWMEYVAGTGKSKIRTNYWSDILTGTDHMEDQGEDGRVIFKMQFTEMGYEATKGMKVAHNRLQWRALICHCSMKGGELQ
jgi:hypothetical protein